MKTTLNKLILLAIIFFAICYGANAQVTMKYRVQIIDSCKGSYSGNYCISAICGRVQGPTFCTYNVNCSFKNISNPITLQYPCYDWPDCLSNATYYVTASACRQSGCSSCNGFNTGQTSYCTDLQDGTLFVTVVIH
jgi:hypothetical protein